VWRSPEAPDHWGLRRVPDRHDHAPTSDSSPKTAYRSSRSRGICPDAAKTLAAKGKLESRPLGGQLIDSAVSGLPRAQLSRPHRASGGVWLINR
jgi:hypothetical protein